MSTKRIKDATITVHRSRVVLVSLALRAKALEYESNTLILRVDDATAAAWKDSAEYLRELDAELCAAAIVPARNHKKEAERREAKAKSV